MKEIVTYIHPNKEVPPLVITREKRTKGMTEITYKGIKLTPTK